MDLNPELESLVMRLLAKTPEERPASAEAVRAGLSEGGHDTVDVRISRSGEWTADGAPVAVEPGRVRR